MKKIKKFNGLNSKKKENQTFLNDKNIKRNKVQEENILGDFIIGELKNNFDTQALELSTKFAKTFKEKLGNLDTIVVSGDDYVEIVQASAKANLTETFFAWENFFVPFIEEGTMKFIGKKNKSIEVFFSVLERSDTEAVIELNFVSDTEWIGTVVLRAGDDNSIGVISYQNPDLLSFGSIALSLKDKRKQQECLEVIENYREHLIKDRLTFGNGKKESRLVEMFVTVVQYINYILTHPQIKEVEKVSGYTRGRSKETNKESKRKKSDVENNNTKGKELPQQKTRVVNLNKIKIVTKNKSTSDILVGKRAYTPCQKSFLVREHTRTYKSGKTIRVKSYTKGSQYKEKLTHTYTIGK